MQKNDTAKEHPTHRTAANI